MNPSAITCLTGKSNLNINNPSFEISKLDEHQIGRSFNASQSQIISNEILNSIIDKPENFSIAKCSTPPNATKPQRQHKNDSKGRKKQ